LEEIYPSPDPYLWSLVLDRKGNLYAGTGNDGRVLRVDTENEGEILFDSQELEVYALAVSPKGRLYAGTTPKGKVFRFDDKGNVEEFFDPEQTYIWDLGFLPDGDLLVATGPAGILYRVDSEGEGEVWFDSEDTHIRSLIIGKDGSVFLGTSGDGLIIRVSPDGEPFVLYDSPLKEITDLALAPDGTLYAAAMSTERTDKAQQRREELKKKTGGAKVTSKNIAVAKSAVYRIDPDGVVGNYWTSPTADIFCLLWSEDGNVLLGTGDPGRVLSLSPEGKESELIRTDSAQVTAMVMSRKGEVFLGTSNLGFVSRLDPGKAGSGEYLSVVKDTSTASDWGNVSWKVDAPKGTAVQILVRTGNTEKPNRTWSEWSEPAVEPAGTRIDRPRARYVQWKAVLSTDSPKETPVLREVAIAYLQRNLPPEVDSVEILTSGTRYQFFSSSSSQQQRPVVPQSQDDKARVQQLNQAALAQSQAQKQRGSLRRSFEKGSRTVTWDASDPNGDSLEFSVYFRGEGEKLWKLLKEEVTQEYYSWDATAMPDGVYRIRVVAQDTPSNPPGEALEGEGESISFTVDHTPPRIEDLQANVMTGKVEIRFLASDSFSPVGEAHFSVDAARWQAIYPEDRVADSQLENYRFETLELVSGEHTIVVRASDEMGNLGTGKLIVEIP
ncbi:MAG: hypothetical protein V3T54_01090, partial [Acidobacteriota bacterium]